MAVSGRKFLQLSAPDAFQISRHALDRLYQHTGRRPGRERAADLFARGRQVSFEQMILLGYRPAYRVRRRAGQNSWYFRLEVGGREVIAVIGQGRRPGVLVWVTTYGLGPQAEQLRLADWSAVRAMA